MPRGQNGVCAEAQDWIVAIWGGVTNFLGRINRKYSGFYDLLLYLKLKSWIYLSNRWPETIAFGEPRSV